MSKEDRDLYNKLNSSLKENISQKKLAEILGTNEATVSECLSEKLEHAHKILFNIKRLAKLRSYYSNSTDPEDIYRLEIADDAYLKEVVRLGNYKKPDFTKAASAMANTMKLLGGIPQGIWLVTSAASINAHLGNLMASDKPLDKLVIAIGSELSQEAVAAIESWAYGTDGNYRDRKEIKLVGLESPPIMEMIGGFKDGEFHGFMDIGEGFAPLDVPELSFLKDELEALMGMDLPEGASLKWSLPVSPEARIIERLRRQAGDEITPDISAYMAELVNRWESGPEGEKHDDDNPFDTLLESLPKAVGQRFGDVAAQSVHSELEAFSLAVRTTR